MASYGAPIFGTVTAPNPLVHTQYGPVLGESRDGIAVFRGIPYGGSCDGEARFFPPSPPRPWQKPLDCTRNGLCAVQLGMSIGAAPGLGPYFSGGHPERFGVLEETQGENCLVLNVVTPGLEQSKRPVVVYLHGGGFSTGSGSLVIGADGWAREEDLVIVGVNHRLNALGYLYLGYLSDAYALSGNAGMLDLVLALEWVRDNISSFGGDPEKVTIMGESGGGMKVSALLSMECASGLFHQAIVESGSAPTMAHSKEQAALITRRILEQLGLKEKDWRQLFILPALELAKASAFEGEEKVCPVGDDILIPYDPSAGYSLPACARHIPLMVGASEDELAVFAPPEAFTLNWETLPHFLVKSSQNQQKPWSLETARKLIQLFQDTSSTPQDPSHLYFSIVSLASFLGGGAYCQATAKAGQKGAQVFHYAIEYDAPLPDRPGVNCAWHTADLPLQMRVVLHPEMESLSRQMAHAWAAFIRTGSPSTSALPWPPFTPEDTCTMVFDHTCSVRQDPWQTRRKALAEIGILPGVQI